jgi:hypothetical protein
MTSIKALHSFLEQDILITENTIKPRESKISTINITGIGPIMSLAVKSDPPHVRLKAVIINENELTVSASSFSEDLVTSFKPEAEDKYDLIITNEGTEEVRADIILGYLSFIDNN